MLKFYKVNLGTALVNMETNLIARILQFRENLNLRCNVLFSNCRLLKMSNGKFAEGSIRSERGDVPGWVLVVLMTTGLVTAIWTIAAPRLSAILRNSLDAMNGIR